MRPASIVWARISEPSDDRGTGGAPATGVAGYSVFRDDVKIGMVVGKATRYVDRFNLKRGKSYRYMLSAYNGVASEPARTAFVSVER